MAVTNNQFASNNRFMNKTNVTLTMFSFFFFFSFFFSLLLLHFIEMNNQPNDRSTNDWFQQPATDTQTETEWKLITRKKMLLIVSNSECETRSRFTVIWLNKKTFITFGCIHNSYGEFMHKWWILYSKRLRLVRCDDYYYYYFGCYYS